MKEDPQELGVEIAGHFDWDCNRIMETFIAALEDANFHSMCALLDVVKDWEPAQLRPLTAFLERVTPNTPKD